jgi:cytochrome P450
MVLEDILTVMARHWPSALAILIIIHFTRNYFHHGLNRYPGPFLARITNWWRFFDVLNRRPEVTHIRLHKTHGDVVRLGPNYLSFADPRAVKDIYGLNKGFIKSDFYPVQQSVSAGHRLPSLFSTTDNTFHANLRRSINSAFSMSTLVQYEPFVDSTTSLFLSQTDKLYASPGITCDFARWLQFYAFDVIGNMTYSERHGFLERNEDIEGIISYLGKLFSYVAPIGQIPFLDLLLLKNPLYLLAAQHGLIDATFPVARFARARLEERISSSPAKPSTGPPDLLSKFIAAQETHPNTVTQKEVLTLAVSMAFAGSETTAISLSSIFYYLLRHPATLSRLLAELDDAEQRGVFADATPGVVSWAEAQKLPYLDAVVKEAFRIHPAAGLPLERVVPPSGATIAGHFIPGGTIVGCSAWVLHGNPSIFGSDASHFRPERWLPKDGSIEEVDRIKEMNAAMFHFGSGSRTCIGRNISLLEIYKVVPSLLRGFEVEFPGGKRGEWRLWNSWFVRQLGFEVRFRRREGGKV